jgi:hypothetical protein
MQMARTLKVRHSHIRNNTDYTISDNDPVAQGTIDELRGARFYLTSQNRAPGATGYTRGNPTTYRLSLRTPQTNRHIERVSGWLGTTDNVDHNALGVVEIVGQSSTHLHLREIEGDELGEQPPAFRALCQRLNAEAEALNAEWIAREEAEYAAAR